VTTKPAQFVQIDLDTWMAGVKAAGCDPDKSLLGDVAIGDETIPTFRKRFGGWWPLWDDGGGEVFTKGRLMGPLREKYVDKVLGEGRVRNLEDWIRPTGYDGK
jgi:hypothetical protein